MVKLPRVFVIGGTSVDEIIPLEKLPEPVPQTLFTVSYRKVGSTGSGKALSFRLLGFPTVLHSVIGGDSEGDLIVSYFERFKLPFIYDIDTQGTERHTNLIDKDGERISIYTRSASPNPPINLKAIEDTLDNSDIIVLNIIHYTKTLISMLKKSKKPIWVDLHDYQLGNEYYDEFINAADVIFLSSDRLSDYERAMEEFIQMGKKLVVCTHGNLGSTALDNGHNWYKCPILPYKFIDPNGAGDNFFAGFMYAYAQGHPTSICLRYGTIVAGLCISSKEIVNTELTPALVEAEYSKYFPSNQ